MCLEKKFELYVKDYYYQKININIMYNYKILTVINRRTPVSMLYRYICGEDVSLMQAMEIISLSCCIDIYDVITSN